MRRTWHRLTGELQWFAARVSYGVVNYRHPSRVEEMEKIRLACSYIPTATTPLECMEIVQAMKACAKAPGDMAEAGVYLGGTAAVMLSASTKRLHLFDTFEGLPHGEGEVFSSGDWTGSVEDVRRNLARWKERIEFHPGLFPASARGLEDLRFSFVHIDLDLFDSTLAALEWFWPRLVQGGILLSHDYPLSEGVVRAFQQFFENMREPFIPLSGNQCLAVKGCTGAAV